jgi:hypothetical protein
MDDRTNRPASPDVVDALDASARDVAERNLHDARSVQAEALRLLADHERARHAASGSRAAPLAKRGRSG